MAIKNKILQLLGHVKQKIFSFADIFSLAVFIKALPPNLASDMKSI